MGGCTHEARIHGLWFSLQIPIVSLLCVTCAVTRCSPALEGLSTHVDELNQRDDFRSFVRKVRRLFQALAEPAGERYQH